MNELFFNSVYLLSNIFSVFFIEKFMSVFFEKKKSKRFFIIAYAAFPILTSSVYLLFNIPIFNLIINVICLFFITFSYKAELKKRINATITIYAFMILTDMFVAAITGYHTVSIFGQISYDKTLGMVIVRLLVYLESILAQNFKNTRKNKPVSNAYWISSFLIPIVSIYLMFVIFSSDDISQTDTILSVAIILLINALTFYLHDALLLLYIHKFETEILKQEKAYYYNQCEIMQSSTEELSGFRHDIKNHLIVLANFLNDSESNESKEYLKSLIGEIESNVIFCSTGNIAFDGIINYNLRNAQNNNIDVICEVKIPKGLNIDVADVVIILGNLLDNATSALLNTEDKKLTIKINYSKGRIFIYVENTFDGYVQYEKDIIVTTKNDKSKHGLGLKNIQRTVDKYNGVLKISHTDKVFKAKILLYLMD